MSDPVNELQGQQAAATFRVPERCVCGKRVQLNFHDGLMYDAEWSESGPERHTCRLGGEPGESGADEPAGDADQLTSKAERVADELIDDNAHAVESLEGVRLLLALAYLRGARDGSVETMSGVRERLARLV